MASKTKRDLTVADHFSLAVASQQPAVDKLDWESTLTRRNQQILANAFENAQTEHLYKELADQAAGDITELASVIASDAHRMHGYSNELLDQAESRAQFDLTTKFLGTLLLPAYAQAQIKLFGRASSNMTDAAMTPIDPRGTRKLTFREWITAKVENA